MNATELMISNYVFDTIRQRNVRIHAIHHSWDYVDVMFGNGVGIYTMNVSRIEPIPLTPELILKCGFKMSITKTCYGLITLGGEHRFSWFTDGGFMIDSSRLYIKVEYLHQLQNLIFVISGTPLDVNF